jgi:transcriptional regulator with XRE-family HTH domain
MVKKSTLVERVYSRLNLRALASLGKEIRLARKERRWTLSELAERAGISRATLQKIEKGDPRCEVGLVFEVAILVGIPLLESDTSSGAAHLKHVDDKLALLPKRVRKNAKVPHDDF